MTSVVGNMFTKRFVDGLSFLHSLNLPKSKSVFNTVAEFIRRQQVYTTMEKCPEVQRLIQDDPEFCQALIDAREYFNLRSDPVNLEPSEYADDPIWSFATRPETILRLGDWQSHWSFTLLEDNRFISCQEALKMWFVRIFAFEYMQEEDDEPILKLFCRERNSSEVKVEMLSPVSTGDGSTLDEIMAENVTENMKRFTEIMNCYRIDSTNNETDPISELLNPSNDFMRAFLVYCWRVALDVEPEPGYFTQNGHLLALATSMLTLWDSQARKEVMPLLEQLYRMRFVPKPSQSEITIFNWMQMITIIANDFALLLCLDRFLDPHLPRIFSFWLFMAFVHIEEVNQWRMPELRASLETVKKNVMDTYSSLLDLVPMSRHQVA